MQPDQPKPMLMGPGPHHPQAIQGPPPIEHWDLGDAEHLGAGATSRVILSGLTRPVGALPTGTPVACKIARADDAGTLAALAREVELLGALQHPALLTILAHGMHQGQPWLLLPRLDGPTLAEAVRLGGLPESSIRSMGARIAGALETLHKHGYVHGDVKPENIMFCTQGDAYLIDMGFAAPIHTPFSERGTPGYLPPEYLSGSDWSPTGDLFALGVCLYEAATGEHPVPSAQGHGQHSPILQGFSRVDARRPSRRAADVSPALDQWLAGALDSDPRSRPSFIETIQELRSSGPWPMRPSKDSSNPWSGALRLPFVGRSEELASIAGLWQETRTENRPTLLIVRSPLGGGGSRLLSEAARRARQQPTYPTLLTGRLTSFHEERPGHVLRGMVRQWLALPPHAAPRQQDCDQLNELLPPTEAAALIEALQPGADGPPQLAEPKAVSAFFARLAARGPLWIQLDDADYGGRASLEPLEMLAQSSGSWPVLLVLGVGKQENPRSVRALQSIEETWALYGKAKQLELGSLNKNAFLEFARAMFVPEQASRELSNALWQRTEGHPGRLRELMRTLESDGKLKTRKGLARLLIEPEAIPMPPSQAQALSARYSQLSLLERTWLVRFAVGGGHVDASLMAKAYEVSEDVVDDQVDHFVRAGWLERSAAGARFRRPQVRRALVRAIPKARLVRLHAGLARALAEPTHGPLVLSRAFEEAWHLKCAGEFSTLAKRLPPMIRAMKSRGHPSRLLLLAQWGLHAQMETGVTDDRQTFVFLILAAQAAHELGKRDQEGPLLDRLADLQLDPHTDSARLGLVQLQMGRFHAATSSPRRACEFFQAARHSFQRTGSIEREAEATLDYGKLCTASGDFGEAQWAVEAAAKLPLRSPERARVHTLRGALALLDDDLEGALKHLNLAKRLLTGDTRRRAKARSAEAELLRSRCYRLLGRPRRALVSLRLAERLAAFAGERTLELEVLVRRGRLLTEFQLEQEAELDLRGGLRLAISIDDRRSRARATLLLGILLAERNQREGAKLLQESLRLAQEYSLPRLEALASTLCARLALKEDKLERAQALSNRALYLIEQVGGELQDRMVALSTAYLIQKERGDANAPRTMRIAVRAWKEAGDRLLVPLNQRRHRRAHQELLKAATTLEGPLYPRTPERLLPQSR